MAQDLQSVFLGILEAQDIIHGWISYVPTRDHLFLRTNTFYWISHDGETVTDKSQPTSDICVFHKPNDLISFHVSRTYLFEATVPP